MNTLPKSYVWFRRVFWATFFILSLCFVVTDWDLKIQSWIFYKGDESWALGEGVFWKLLYYAAPYASVILTLVALVTWIAGPTVKSDLRPILRHVQTSYLND